MTNELRLSLPQVTLCAVASVNVRATLRALSASLDQIAFSDCLLFTYVEVTPPRPEIRVVPVQRIDSLASYSHFVLAEMVEHVTTSHCLVTQWDGHVLDARRWRPEFLDYDYIGARWQHFGDAYDVGNGGFSLRSRRLMDACRQPGFVASHPEDVAIGRSNRAWLEGRGMRFAPSQLADAFSAERAGDITSSFGYHGVWNMPRATGLQPFWEVYRRSGRPRHAATRFRRDPSRGASGTVREPPCCPIALGPLQARKTLKTTGDSNAQAGTFLTRTQTSPILHSIKGCLTRSERGRGTIDKAADPHGEG